MTPNRIRVGISGLPLGNRSGTGYYTEQLLRVLSERGDDEFDLHLLSVENHRAETPVSMHRSVSTAALRWPFSLFSNRLIDKNLQGLDLVHYPNCVGPPITSRPLVATLHDISPFVCPETFPRRTALYLKRVFFNVCRLARVILTDSQWQAERIRKLWPDFSEKLRVVYPTVSPPYRAAAGKGAYSDPATPPYLLMVGTLEPRKEVTLAINAWRSSRLPVDLCLVGRWGWKTRQLRQTLADVGPITHTPSSETVWTGPDGRKVRHLCEVPTERLVELYRKATALIYPSKFEGFGLPVLEALMVGCPVLTRKDSSMEEIAGPAGWYFDGAHPETLSKAIHELIEEPGECRNRAELGVERCEEFSDETFYRGIRAAYTSAVESS